MDTPKSREEGVQLLAQINQAQQLAFDAFNSKDFQAQILVTGTKKDGARFTAVLKTDANDPAAVKFFEDTAGNLYAKRIVLENFLNPPKISDQDNDKLKVESEG